MERYYEILSWKPYTTIEADINKLVAMKLLKVLIDFKIQQFHMWIQSDYIIDHSSFLQIIQAKLRMGMFKN